MKLDRRAFIEILVGGGLGAGAGITLSPLPWKLTDDVAIWTQNWPWVPVPSEGQVSHADTVCNLCPGMCGITVRKVADRATKIEGREGYPVNDGGICPLGAAGLQLLYGPWRVPGPVKRVGKRGEGHWEKISWAEALQTVSGKLGQLRTAGRPESVACITGADRGTVSELFARFMAAYGSPNFMALPTSEDTGRIAMKLLQGTESAIGYDLEGADFILSFGSGLIEGWGSPVRAIQAHSKWRSGETGKRATVVQIEPRVSNTAAKADKWYAVKPGQEATLALSLAHVIVEESLYDTAFVNTRTSNFGAWRRSVLADYSPQDVSSTTGLAANTIRDLARAFAKAKRPLAVWGKGKGTLPGSLYECMSILSLNALVGNLNQPGGLWAVPESVSMKWPSVPQDGTAQRGVGQPRLDGVNSSDLAKYRPDRFAGAIDENPEAVQALLVHDADPYFTMMDHHRVADAFEKIPFVVSFSTYYDGTAQHADLILPHHQYLERWEDIPSPVGLHKPVAGLLKPVVSRRLDTKHAGDTILALASGMGGSIANAFPWQDYQSILKTAMGSNWDTLADTGYARLQEGPAAGTFSFYTEAYEPVELEGDAYTQPLTLIPVELMRLADGAIGNPPFCTKTLEVTELKGNDLFVEINPKTAADFGLAEGKYAMLETYKGTAKVLIHLSEGIMPGLVGIPKGLGHKGYDDYLAGKGVNANGLMGVVEDPISGLCATWGIRAKLTSV